MFSEGDGGTRVLGQLLKKYTNYLGSTVARKTGTGVSVVAYLQAEPGFEPKKEVLWGHEGERVQKPCKQRDTLLPCQDSARYPGLSPVL